MSSAKTIILEYVCPILGTIMGNVMFFAPARDVHHAVLRGSLGDLNPTPWAFMTGNCAGWVTYSILIENYFVYVANAPGFLLSIWLNLCAAKLQYQGHYKNEMRRSLVKLLSKEKAREELMPTDDDDKEKSIELEGEEQSFEGQPRSIAIVQRAVDVGKLVLQVTSQKTPAPARHEKLVVAIVILWTIVISIVGFGRSSLSDSQREYIVGFVVNVNLFFFYGAPLSTIFQVLRTRNSASIHLPTMFTNTANATFWAAYAFAITDPFIYVPNGIGVLLGVVQFVLYLILPRRLSGDADDNDKSSVEELSDKEEGQEQSADEEDIEMFPQQPATSLGYGSQHEKASSM